MVPDEYFGGGTHNGDFLLIVAVGDAIGVPETQVGHECHVNGNMIDPLPAAVSGELEPEGLIKIDEMD